MIKLVSKFLVVLSFIATGAANATLITTDLTEDTYITYNDIDWTWASPVNSASFGVNTLFGPELHAGWRYATLDELDTLYYDITIAAFTKTDGNGNETYIQSVEYWNDVFVSLTEAGDSESAVSVSNFTDGLISSDPDYVFDWWTTSTKTFERFYVRDVADRVPTDVPEPSTVMIFSTALIALSMRKRAIK